MSNSPWIAVTICSFLLTYLFHSTVIIGGITLLVRTTRLVESPALRVLAWKLAMLLPLLTTACVTYFPQCHIGFQFPLGEAPATDVMRQDTASSTLADRVANPAETNISGFDYAARDAASPADSYLIDAAEYIPEPNRGTSLFSAHSVFQLMAGIWLAAVAIGLIRLFIQTKRLQMLRKKAARIDSPFIQQSLEQLLRKMRVVRRVELLQSDEISGAFTAGIWRPFIVVQAQSDEVANQRDKGPEWEALLAHELAHIAHRDAAWNFMAQFIQRLLPLQPLNRIVSRRLQVAMDFAADESAARILGGYQDLIECLIRLGDQMVARHTPDWTRSGLAAGMAVLRSTLGQRVETLLENSSRDPQSARRSKLLVLTCLTAGAMSAATISPQAIAHKNVDIPEHPSTARQENSMKSHFATLAVLVGLTAPVTADEPHESSNSVRASSELKATPDELPNGIQRFNGMVVGRLAAKDVEKGSFVVTVDAVPRVWRNSGAENPKSIVGKSIQIEGVFGKFLDVLVVTRIGETIEFECKHDGDALVFPGELLRKVAPYKAEDYPVLPEKFRGFHGALVGEIKSKDPETFELIIEVQKVSDVWAESRAEQPESIVGKTMMLAGFWNRKDAYHSMKVGDKIEVGMQHIGRQSDHLTVAERPKAADRVETDNMRKEEADGDRMMKGTRGFRGMLVGRLVKKDVERGTFTVTVDAVPRVWNNNESSAPKSLIGKNVDVAGVPSQLLDALVVTRVGETVQFGALDDGEGTLRVGEVLRKVGPVQPGDYPELPDDFRGFSGVLVGKVVKKNEQLWELTVEITDVVKAFEKDRSRNAKSIVGKQVMLSGFWNKKDAFHSFDVGDMIQTGVEHPQKLADQLSVIESVQKVRD